MFTRLTFRTINEELRRGAIFRASAASLEVLQATRAYTRLLTAGDKRFSPTAAGVGVAKAA